MRNFAYNPLYGITVTTKFNPNENLVWKSGKGKEHYGYVRYIKILFREKKYKKFPHYRIVIIYCMSEYSYNAIIEVRENRLYRINLK